MRCTVGLGTEFLSEKIPRNRLGTDSIFAGKEVLIPRQSEFCERTNSEARNGTERNSATGIPREKNMTLAVDMEGVLFISSW